MKKFSRILQYLAKYKGLLLLYFLFTILATLFGLISLGMLSPFMDILFKSGATTAKQVTVNTNAIGSLKNFIVYIISRYHPIGGLIAICLFIVVTTFLKNL